MQGLTRSVQCSVLVAPRLWRLTWSPPHGRRLLLLLLLFKCGSVLLLLCLLLLLGPLLLGP